MQKGKGGYIMIPIALLFALDISQEEKVKKLLDHGKPVLLTELGDGKNDVFVMPKETDDGVLLENVYGYDILVGEEETTSVQHQGGGTQLYLHELTIDTSGGEKKYYLVTKFDTLITQDNIANLVGEDSIGTSSSAKNTILSIHNEDGEIILAMGFYDDHIYESKISGAGVVSGYSEGAGGHVLNDVVTKY